MPHDDLRPEQSVSSLPQARARALKLLTGRQLSIAVLKRKLEAEGFLSEVVVAVMAECQSWGYANDGRLAEAWAHTASRRGKGPAWLRAKLTRDGISGDQAQAALAGYASNEKMLADQAVQKRFGVLPAGTSDPDRRLRARAARFLASRGFSSSAIAHALRAADAWAAEMGDEDESS